MEAMSPAAFHDLVRESRAMGNVFFGIVGGEPFMHPQLFDLLEPHGDCYFQVFTNGQFITEAKARRLRRMGNVSPLISVEGTEIISDQRRGRPGVLSKTLQGVHHSIKHKLFTGVCTSLCQTNFDDLLTEKWIDRLIDMGVMYTWFHVYRPMGPEANPQLSLTPAQQLQARQFVVEMRAKKPIIIIDAYYDGEGRALCPAATGLSHHINPWGDIEPCPIVQFTMENALGASHLAHRGGTGYEDSARTNSEEPRAKSPEPKRDLRPLRQKFLQSEFLRDFRNLAQETTRGCIVLERPDLLKELVERHAARDSTVRGTALAELAAMKPRTSQFNPGNEVPEKNPFYRFAKRLWFHDFGVYQGHHPA
jgi:MoaA/NifB/PqqE/SkfB family radical SAM enzyme